MKNNPAIHVPWCLILVLSLLFLVSVAWLNYGNYNGGPITADLIASIILLSIPTGLTYFSIGILILAARQKRNHEVINRKLARLLFWTPRIAGILICLFIAMFALDVFSGEGSIWWRMLGFLAESSPAIVLAILLAFAWRWEQIGFFAFLIGAIFFLFYVRNPMQDIGLFFLFSMPLLMIAVLFWANWRWKEDIRFSAGKDTRPTEA
jgi:hypothetical protein